MFEKENTPKVEGCKGVINNVFRDDNSHTFLALAQNEYVLQGKQKYQDMKLLGRGTFTRPNWDHPIDSSRIGICFGK